MKKSKKMAIVDTIHDTIDLAFRMSQQRCPVDTGALKSSGIVQHNDQGSIIMYLAPHASIVNRGFKGGEVFVKGYYRSDGVFVKGHSRYMRERNGTFFISKSIEEALINFAPLLEKRLIS